LKFLDHELWLKKLLNFGNADAKGWATGAIVGEKHRHQGALIRQERSHGLHIGRPQTGIDRTKAGVLNHPIKLPNPIGRQIENICLHKFRHHTPIAGSLVSFGNGGRSQIKPHDLKAPIG
jgi:hypothetical protein